MADLLDCIETTAGGNQTAEQVAASVIWLHGLGADGNDFAPIVPELALGDLRLRFVFPHAPQRPVAINGGAVMRAWYDINPAQGLLSGGDDIEQSGQQVSALIEREMARGVPSTRIVLAGFSQGGVIALHTALRYRQPLAGVIALSTYLHDHENIAQALSFENLDLPILMCHGRFDPMIPITRAIIAREALLALNFKVQWHEYDMAHQVCKAEIDVIATWLRARLA